jgi:hypothetical protein
MSLTLLLGVAVVLSVSANPLTAHESSGLVQVAVPHDLTTGARTLARPQVTSLIVPSPKTDPFAKLFRSTDLTKRGQPGVALPLPPKSTQVCGMTIWRVDPGVDPGIHLPTFDRDVEFKIRRITPPACRE